MKIQMKLHLLYIVAIVLLASCKMKFLTIQTTNNRYSS